MNSGQGDCRDPGKHHKQSILAGYSQPSSALCTQSSLGCKELPSPSAEFLSLQLLIPTPKCRTSSFQPSLQFISLPNYHELSRWLRGKETTYQSRRNKRCGFYPWVGKIPWGRKWQPTPVFLPGKFHEQKSLVGYSPWGHKESDTREQQGAHAHEFSSS